MRNMLLVKSELEIMDYHESVNKRGEYWIPGNYCLRLLRSETQLGSFFGLLEYTHTHTHTHHASPISSSQSATPRSIKKVSIVISHLTRA